MLFFKKDLKRFLCPDILRSLRVAVRYAFHFGAEQRLPPAVVPVRRKPVLIDGRCVGCRLCLKICPSHALSVRTVRTDDGWRAEDFKIDSDRCVSCGLCAEACPERALDFTAEKEGADVHR